MALGFSVHTGWAALVAITGTARREISVLDRRRIVMIPDGDRQQPRFVYHAARDLSIAEAERRVRESSERAEREAREALEASIHRLGSAGHAVVASALIGGNPPLSASLEAILKNHSLLHAAEGALFRGAIRAASEALGLPVTEVKARELVDRAARGLGVSASRLGELLAAVGREAGPPWGKDQKDACLAALLAFPA